MKEVVKGFDKFTKINENEELEGDMPFRLYGQGDNPKQALIRDLKELITMINKSNPSTQEEYDAIKDMIKNKAEELKSHPDFEEFKEEGFEWQDRVIKLSDWHADLRQAVHALSAKVSKKGLV